MSWSPDIDSGMVSNTYVKRDVTFGPPGRRWRVEHLAGGRHRAALAPLPAEVAETLLRP